MPRSAFKGTANITDQGIKKHFKNYEPWQALFELVWNGLDAKASRIDINIESNNMDGLELIHVIDNGDGIDFHNFSDNFDRFNESLKKGASLHGSQATEGDVCLFTDYAKMHHGTHGLGAKTPVFQLIVLM